MTAFVVRDGEITVNDTVTGNQLTSSIASLPGGGFVVTWVDASRLNDDTEISAIMAQILDKDGNPVGSEIPVNSTVAGQQFEPAITVLASGNFVISWSDGSQASGAAAFDVRAQMFDVRGRLLRGEFVLNAAVPFDQHGSALTALSNGGFMAVWESNAEDNGGFNSHLHAQRFDARGRPVGDDILVDRGIVRSHKDAAITELSDGTVLVTWTRTTAGNSGQAWAQRIAKDGTLLGDVMFLSATIGSGAHPAVEALADGRYIAAWESLNSADRGVVARIFEANGTPVAPAFQVNDAYGDYNDPTIALLSDGNFVVVFRTRAGEILAQVYDDAGRKLGSELSISSGAANSTLPDVTARDDGGFAVTWTDVSAKDGSGSGIQVRIVDRDDILHVLRGDGDANTLEAPTTAQWKLLGLAGNDTLVGSIYADQLDGGKDADRMTGGSGNDTYAVDHVGDVVVELSGEGVDTVISSLRSYTLANYSEILQLAGSGNNNGTGNDFANALLGNAGRNVLDGGRGNDIISGGAGRDTLTGGAGSDRFVFEDGDFSGTDRKTADRITDFSQQFDDVIDLTRVDGNITTEAIDPFTFIRRAAFSGKAGELRYIFSGQDTVISGDTNGDGLADFSIVLTGRVALAKDDLAFAPRVRGAGMLDHADVSQGLAVGEAAAIPTPDQHFVF